MQVYVLAIVAAMQRGAEPNKESDLIILVPPYDPAEIFSPSYGHDEVAHKEAAATPSLRCASFHISRQPFRPHKLARLWHEPVAQRLPIWQMLACCCLQKSCTF